MQIKDNCVVAMHYTLTNDQGQVLDSSEGRDPLKFLQGAHNIIIGLEKAMAGKQVGDSFEVSIEPEEAYGVRHEQMIQKVPKSAFQGVDNIEVGMSFQAQTEHGPVPVKITEVIGDVVTVDGNHELAGERLHFKVSIEEVREATKEEMEHNHAH
ncbi:MAG: peptidylprolyl isomerase [Marinicella sp.]|nr:peptidylprolyl isomerase [Xanthomonadales bacterium]